MKRLWFGLTIIGLLIPPILGRAVSVTDTDTPTESPTFSPSPTWTVTPTPTAVCGSTFGCAACTPTVSSNVGANGIFGTQTTMPGGTVYSLAVYLTSIDGGFVRMGLAEDDGGNIGRLLIESGDQTSVDGWNVFSVNPTYLASGTYWILDESQPSRSHHEIASGRSFIWGGIGPPPVYGPLPKNGISGGPGGYFTSSYLQYASYCPGPPIFYTPTPTETSTPAFQTAPQGKLALGPVPVRKGSPLCLYFPQAPRSSEWEVYNLRGQLVSSLSFGFGEDACLATAGFAPGIYVVRAKVDYATGASETMMKKVVVIP